MDKAEQQAEEILVELGFIDPEELEPETAELLRQHHRRILEAFRIETSQLLTRYEWVRKAMFGDPE